MNPLRVALCALSLLAMSDADAAKRYVDSLPSKSYIIESYSPEQAETRLLTEPIASVEGLYDLTIDGSLISVEKWTPDDRPTDNLTYLRLVVVRSPNRSIRPGTVFGYMTPAARSKAYDARIYTSLNGNGVLSNPKTYRLMLSDNGALVFNKVKSGVIINWNKLLPRRVRYIFDYRPDDRNGYDGLIPHSPDLPRYL